MELSTRGWLRRFAPLLDPSCEMGEATAMLRLRQSCLLDGAMTG